MPFLCALHIGLLPVCAEAQAPQNASPQNLPLSANRQATPAGIIQQFSETVSNLNPAQFDSLKNQLIQHADESIPLIIHMLEDKKPLLVWKDGRFIDVLKAIRTPKAINAIIDIAERSPNQLIRSQAMWALGEIGQDAKGAVPYLSKLTENDNNYFDPNETGLIGITTAEQGIQEEKELALLTLQKIGTGDATAVVQSRIDALKQQLLKGDILSRRTAAESLSSMIFFTHISVPEVTTALHDQDSIVRLIAATTLLDKANDSVEIQHVLMELAIGQDNMTKYKDKTIKQQALEVLLNCINGYTCSTPAPDLHAYLIDMTKKDKSVADDRFLREQINKFATLEENQALNECDRMAQPDPLARELSTRAFILGADNTIFAAGDMDQTKTAGSEVIANSSFGAAHYKADYTIDKDFRSHVLGWSPKLTTGVATVIVQNGDKFILGGFTNNQAMVVSLLPSGALDTSFGKEGVASFDMKQFETLSDTAMAHIHIAVPTEWFSSINALAIGSNKEIYASGAAGYHPFITKLLPSGAVDTSFGRKGAIELGIPSGASGDVNALTITSDNKIIALGNALWASANPLRESIVLAKFNTNGTPDKTFGADGLVIKDLPKNLNLHAEKILLQANGKIIIAVSVPEEGFLLFRFTQDGQQDMNFGISGQVKLDIPISAASGGGQYGLNVLQESGNKLIVAGFALKPSNDGFTAFAQRFDADGKKDETYGNQGLATEDMGYVQVHMVAIDKNDKLIAVSENKSKQSCLSDPIAAKAPPQTASSSALESYRQQCEKIMTDYAKVHNADPINYIAQNQAYLQTCIQYLSNHKSN